MRQKAPVGWDMCTSRVITAICGVPGVRANDTRMRTVLGNEMYYARGCTALNHRDTEGTENDWETAHMPTWES
jgi:hypothetical protein